jgi:copper chaperone CopZ
VEQALELEHRISGLSRSRRALIRQDGNEEGIMKMARAGGLLCVAVLCGGLGLAQGAAEQKVTLMLGGKFCDAYLGDVEAALKKIAGVKAVDVKSMKGHVLVTVDGDKVKASQLATAVNGVKGDGWYCTGQVMK